nr:uncharacterized protein LOC129382007 [Dermacentor andersoni]
MGLMVFFATMLPLMLPVVVGKEAACKSSQGLKFDHATWPYPSVFAYDNNTDECKEYPADSIPTDGTRTVYQTMYSCFVDCTPDHPPPKQCMSPMYEPCDQCFTTAYYYNHHDMICSQYYTSTEYWFPPEDSNCFGNNETCQRQCQGFGHKNENGNRHRK